MVTSTLAKLSRGHSVTAECQQWRVTHAHVSSRKRVQGSRPSGVPLRLPSTYGVWAKGFRVTGKFLRLAVNLLRAEAFVYARVKNLDHGEGRGARATQYKGNGVRV